MSEAALAAWNRKFTTRIVEVGKGEPGLFNAGRRLGGGGIGVVHETTLDGIALAVKRTYTRRLTDHQWNEIKILGQISEQRHQHIVQLIGSYVHRQRSGYELGILLWPVAQTDLAAFLQDVDYLRAWLIAPSETHPSQHNDLPSVIDELALLVDYDLEADMPGFDPFLQRYFLHQAAMRYLAQCIGCIAKAIAWLHHHDIRHKDLKPAQILLSSKGLWLTDFGWSKDVSDLTDSATSGGEMMTLKYHAPERAARERCGKAEDVFALGCVLLEIGTRLTTSTNRTPFHALPVLVLPWTQKMWSFHANLHHIDTWLKPFFDDREERLRLIGELIKRMMSYKAEDRPRMGDIVAYIFGTQRLGSRHVIANFFHDCCGPAQEVESSLIGITHPERKDRSSTSDEMELDPVEYDLRAPVSPALLHYVSGHQPNPEAMLLDEELQPEDAGMDDLSTANEDAQRDSKFPSEPEVSLRKVPTGYGIIRTSSTKPDIVRCDKAGCHATFTGRYRTGNLSRHQRQQHGAESNNYPCGIEGCDHAYQRKSHLLRHQRIHHPNASDAAPS
jgi:serine/threonine protein kinase